MKPRTFSAACLALALALTGALCAPAQAFSPTRHQMGIRIEIWDRHSNEGLVPALGGNEPIVFSDDKRLGIQVLESHAAWTTSLHGRHHPMQMEMQHNPTYGVNAVFSVRQLPSHLFIWSGYGLRREIIFTRWSGSREGMLLLRPRNPDAVWVVIAPSGKVPSLRPSSGL